MIEKPTFWEYMVMPLKKYADFSGRARRMEYWAFGILQFLILAILFGGLFIVTDALSSSTMYGSGPDDTAFIIIGIVAIVATLALLIPNLAVTVRRLHDINLSGWFILLTLIPYIGSIISLVFALIPGVPEQNKWGKNPKNFSEIEETGIDSHLIIED